MQGRGSRRVSFWPKTVTDPCARARTRDKNKLPRAASELVPKKTNSGVLVIGAGEAHHRSNPAEAKTGSTTGDTTSEIIRTSISLSSRNLLKPPEAWVDCYFWQGPRTPCTFSICSNWTSPPKQHQSARKHVELQRPCMTLEPRSTR